MLRRFIRLIVGLLCVPLLPVLILVSFFIWVIYDTFLIARIMDFILLGKELTFYEHE